MLAEKLALSTFTKEREMKLIYIQIDNTAALRDLLKMGETQNQKLKYLSEEIWVCLFSWGIIITAEYLPSVMNTQAYIKTRQGKLILQVFHKICEYVENQK